MSVRNPCQTQLETNSFQAIAIYSTKSQSILTLRGFRDKDGQAFRSIPRYFYVSRYYLVIPAQIISSSSLPRHRRQEVTFSFLHFNNSTTCHCSHRSTVLEITHNPFQIGVSSHNTVSCPNLAIHIKHHYYLILRHSNQNLNQNGVGPKLH